MKTFSKSLEEKIKDLPTPNYEEDNFDAGVIHGFESGANWAAQSPELINEILTKYMDWSLNLTDAQLANWEDEEGSLEKTKARIRKEFIEFLKREQ